MKSPYVSELQPNQVVTATFLVQQKDIRQKKTGEPYLSLVLGDRTGEVEAKMWDNVAEVMDTFERDDFLKVRGLLQVYHNRLQMTVHKLRKEVDSSVDFTDFFPASKRDREEMFLELNQLIAAIQNEHLRGLLQAVAGDESLASRLKVAPAAKNIHHAYLGGLLEHVLSLCTLAKLIAGHYPEVDLDLLLTGAILHDIGKVDELTYDRSFGYTTDGQLLGHIFLGLRILDEKLRGLPDFPPSLRKLIEHMILSHHGTLEFGSPKVPVFPEALLLHHLDNLDSKMECMRSFLQKDKQVEGCWTGYIPSLERSVLKKEKYFGAPAIAASTVEPVQIPAATKAQTPHSPPSPSSSPFAEKLQTALKS